jgi:CheY-like chemotaxis protein
MKILFVEDQKIKRDQIVKFLTKTMGQHLSVTHENSVRSALREIALNSAEYDLILLDMSMPNFDPTPDNPEGSSPESFAGKELLEQMQLREIFVPVIVVTQFTSFEGGRVTLEDLTKNLGSQFFENYRGFVYFNSVDETWKKELIKIIRAINQ